MLKPFDPEPALQLSPWLYGDSNVAFFANRDPNGIWSSRYISHLINGTGMGVKCLRDNPLRYSPLPINQHSLLEYVGNNCLH